MSFSQPACLTEQVQRSRTLSKAILSKPTSNVDEDCVQVTGGEGRLQRAQGRDFDMTLIRV